MNSRQRVDVAVADTSFDVQWVLRAGQWLR